jgi:hypothetical protein
VFRKETDVSTRRITFVFTVEELKLLPTFAASLFALIFGPEDGGSALLPKNIIFLLLLLISVRG